MTPRTVRVRCYTRDWVLVSVRYDAAQADGRDERHLLVGSGDPPPALAADCGGTLDAVVVTRPPPGAVERAAGITGPAAVVRAWTGMRGRRSPLPAMVRGAPDGWDGATTLVRSGDRGILAGELPGVTVDVLGPPGPDRLPELLRPGASFFALDEAGVLPPPAPPPREAWTDALTTLAEPGTAGAAERLLRRLRDRPVSQAQAIAAAVEDVACNTSVALLLAVGGRTVLLPGDTGTAGWAPLLDRAYGTADVPADPVAAQQLSDVDVVVVGRHGDRRATPTRLRALWRRRDRPLDSVLREGPRTDRALVADLERLGRVHRPGPASPCDVELQADR